MKSNAEHARNYRIRLKQEVMNHYSSDGVPKCVICGDDFIAELTFEHINHNGGKERREKKVGSGSNFYNYLKRNNYPKDNLEIRCYNCNCNRDHLSINPKNLYGNLSNILSKGY